MVAFFCPPPFMKAVSAEPFAASYVGFVNPANAANATFTVTNVGIGEPSASRIVVLTVHSIVFGGTTLNSVTIGGVAATLVQQAVANSVGVIIAYALVPLGVSANIVFTFNTAPLANGVRFGVYRIVGANSNSPYSSAINSTGNDGTKSINLSTPDGGIAIVAATSINTVSITGVSSMDYNNTGSNNEVVKTGRLQPTSLSSSVTFTTSTRVMVGASWR